MVPSHLKHYNCGYGDPEDVGVQAELTHDLAWSWSGDRPGRPFRNNRIEFAFSVVKPKQNEGDVEGKTQFSPEENANNTALMPKVDALAAKQDLLKRSRAQGPYNSNVRKNSEVSWVRTRVSTNDDSAEDPSLSSSYWRMLGSGQWTGAKESLIKLAELEKDGLMGQFGKHLTQRTEENSLELSEIASFTDQSEESLSLKF